MKIDRTWFQNLLIGISGLLIAFSAAEKNITKYFFVKEFIFDLALATGMVLLFISIFVALTPIGLPLMPVEYSLQRAKPSELATVQLMGKEQIGPSVISLKTLREWYEKNREAVYVVKRRLKYFPAKEKIVGFFCVVPITNFASERFRKNREGGFQLTVENILPNFSSNAIYIAAIASTTLWARGKTVQWLEGYLAGKTSSCVHVFASPVSEYGISLCGRAGLCPVDEETDPLETIFHREFSEKFKSTPENSRKRKNK